MKIFLTMHTLFGTALLDTLGVAVCLAQKINVCSSALSKSVLNVRSIVKNKTWTP